MKRYISILGCLFVGVAMAQNGQDVIQLPGIGNRTIEPAYRMIESPKIIDTTITTNVVEYPLLVVQRETKIEVENIPPATIKTDALLDQFYNTYVKLGIGSELMPLGEIYFDSKRSRKFVYGAHVKHLSSFGNFENYAPSTFDRTKLGLYGSLNESKYTLSSQLHYNNQGLHYYGLQVPTESVSRDSIAQRYQDVGGTFNFIYHKKDSAVFNYRIGVDYNNFSSKKPSIDSLADWRAMENYFAFRSGLTYKGGKEIYDVDLNVRYNAYKYGVFGDSSLSSIDTGIVRNNTIINLKPTISTFSKDNRFRARIGVDLTVDAADSARVYIYPVAELKYSLFNDIFIPYLGIKGGLKQQSVKSLTTDNEFLLPNVIMRNENTVIDLYGGIKGTLSKRMSFNLGASFTKINDKVFFVTDTLYAAGNKFNLIYDSLNLATIEGSLSYQLMEKLKIDATGKFFSYDLNNIPYAWNLPQWQAIVRGSYNLFDKFLVNLDANIEGGRNALVYKMEDGVKEEDQLYIKPLGTIIDLNLGLEYRYNKRISAFVQLNNLASQRYMRWYNYPVQIFQVMGGVTARF